MWYSETKTHHR